jgi:hypothetical protein
MVPSGLGPRASGIVVSPDRRRSARGFHRVNHARATRETTARPAPPGCVVHRRPIRLRHGRAGASGGRGSTCERLGRHRRAVGRHPIRWSTWPCCRRATSSCRDGDGVALHAHRGGGLSGPRPRAPADDDGRMCLLSWTASPPSSGGWSSRRRDGARRRLLSRSDSNRGRACGNPAFARTVRHRAPLGPAARSRDPRVR